MQILSSDILTYLNYAEMARMSEPVLRKALDCPKEDLVFIDNKETDTQGFMYYDHHSKNLITSFRGSQQLQDWLNDFNAFHMDYPYGNKNTKIRVHRGIMGCWLSVRDKVLSVIDEWVLSRKKKPLYSLVFNGHSLGGALTTLGIIDVQYNFREELEHNHPIYGYASGNPAVFNKAGAVSFDKRVPNFVRTYMRKDWVPRLPPEWFGKKLKGGYRHCGRANPIGPRSWLTGLRVWLKSRTDLAGNLTNHSIPLYRKYLNG